VETEESMDAPHRMIECRRVLPGKARLVVVVPQGHAMRCRERLLELNNW
jgi:hypothetical protein